MDSLSYKIARSDEHAQAQHASFRTLVIDIDARRNVTAQALRKRGHEVQLCGSLDEAAALLAAHSFELILLSYWSDPAATGEAVARLRAALAGRGGVLALTLSLDCTASALELTSVGADDFFPLPLTGPAGQERLARVEKSVLATKQHDKREFLLRESDERFRTITDHSPVFFRMTGPEGLAEYFNRAWLQFTGRKLDRELGYGWAELIRPDQREAVLDAMLTGVKTCSPFRAEYQLRRNDGSYRWFLETGAPRTTEDGAFYGHISSCIDITDLKQSEEALRRAEEKYRSIFENAIEGIFQTTPDGRYLNANRALARIYGYSSPEDLMSGLTDIAHQLYVRRGRREEFVRLLREMDVVENFESQIYRRDGSIIWIAENSRAVRDNSGRVLYYEGTVEDITDRKLTAERLRMMESAVINTQDAVIVLEAPLSERGELAIVYVNPAFTRLTGYERRDVEGRAPSVLNGEHTDPQHLNRIKTAIALTEPVNVELIQYRKDGSEYWADIHIAPILDGSSRVTHFVAVQHDATERKKIEQALRESEERYALAATGGNDGVWDWDLQSNKIYYSPQWKAMLGLQAGQLTASPEEWFSRVHPDDNEELRDHLNAHFEGRQDTFRCEFRMRHADGTFRWMISRGVAVRGADSKPLRLAGSQTDISARKLAELQLKHDAYHDTLTGLPNRALLMDRLRQVINRGKRKPDYKFVLLFLDLNRFKQINDTMGHLAGDQLLIAIARRLEVCLRPTDSVARLGGDEFVILGEDLNEIDAQRVAERIRTELEAPFNIDGREVSISASIGITVGNVENDRAEDLLRKADTAMYRVKTADRIRLQPIQSSMDLPAINAAPAPDMEPDLRRAIEREEFFLEYQPVVSLPLRTIQGFEALVRWRHPVLGIVSPIAFIPLAESTGLIKQISQWVLATACRQLREWNVSVAGGRQIFVSVNMSGRCCSSTRMADFVGEVIARYGIDPTRLKLELTESSIVERAGRTDAFFAQIKKANVKFMIDDFGTGYSSLSYLHRITAEAIKIDRSFVRDMMTAQKNFEIIRAVIALARTLKMEVIAEGVETHEQLARLCELRCDGAQGYLFSRPTGAEAATKLLEQSAL